MSNNIESPEFWERVKSDFEGTGEHFICLASDFFESQWIISKVQKAIRKHANEFLKTSDFKDRHAVGIPNANLFFSDLETEAVYCEYHEIRIEFINYMIQKTKNNLRV